MSSLLAGTSMATGSGFASVLIVMAMPIVDMALCRALDAWAERQRAERATPGIIAAYQPIFRRVIHIVVIVAGAIVVARIWHLDLFHIAERSLGGRIASSLLGIGLVLLAAYMTWQITKMAIERRLQVEGERAEDVPATRVRTLLPILRATILVTIFVMASMSILAALGVDILPLLAGASVVGVAIGFGSQTLVRDIVSGAFFLMDDAFRLGEYIEVGDAKGRVEKINVRSVFLRHHRGALKHPAVRRDQAAAQHEPRLAGARNGVPPHLRHEHGAGQEDHQADRRGALCRPRLRLRHIAAAQIGRRDGGGGQRGSRARQVHVAAHQQRMGCAPHGIRQDHPGVPRVRHQVRAPAGDGERAVERP
jgi:hypothetical protein